MHSITETAAEKCNRLHEKLTGLARMSLETAIEIGGILAEQKSRLRHGQWLPWCQENLAFSERSSQKYLALHQHQVKILKSAAAADLGVDAAYRLLSQSEDEEENEGGEEPYFEMEEEWIAREAPSLEDRLASDPELREVREKTLASGAILERRIESYEKEIARTEWMLRFKAAIQRLTNDISGLKGRRELPLGTMKALRLNVKILLDQIDHDIEKLKEEEEEEV